MESLRETMAAELADLEARSLRRRLRRLESAPEPRGRPEHVKAREAEHDLAHGFGFQEKLER